MPNYKGLIDGFAVGDDLLVRRTIDRTLSNLASSVNVTDAWFTVKTAPSIADIDDTGAVFQKQVTTIDVPGTGQIEDDGGGDVDPILRFDLTDVDTRAIGTTHMHYDIQVKVTGGGIYTGERGEIWGTGDVTIDIT